MCNRSDTTDQSRKHALGDCCRYSSSIQQTVNFHVTFVATPIPTTATAATIVTITSTTTIFYSCDGSWRSLALLISAARNKEIAILQCQFLSIFNRISTILPIFLFSSVFPFIIICNITNYSCSRHSEFHILMNIFTLYSFVNSCRRFSLLVSSFRDSLNTYISKALFFRFLLINFLALSKAQKSKIRSIVSIGFLGLNIGLHCKYIYSFLEILATIVRL